MTGGPEPRRGPILSPELAGCDPTLPPWPLCWPDVPELAPEDLFASCATTLLASEDRLLLAVSGGSDSMGLLAAAIRWDRHRVAVVHVHHGLRASADEDSRLVRDVASQLELPFEIVNAPPSVTSDGHDSHGKTETAARERRMAALSSVARRRAISWVATAHHREDALETMLLHMLRGHRGDRALASIPTVRKLDTDTRMLRPFLFAEATGRHALSTMRTEAGLPFREDPTNRDLSIPRNAVRALLKDAQPPLDAHTLNPLRLAARKRLETRLASVASRLETAWHLEGAGCRVDSTAWHPPEGDSQQAWVPELLRLIGAGLCAPRVVAPRASVVGELIRMLDKGHGDLEVPADPTPLKLRVSSSAVHFLNERVAEIDTASRILQSLSQTSLYV